MTGFGVEQQDLQSTAHQLSAVLADLDAGFAPVRAQLDSVVDASWSGAAARSFGEGWHDWLRGYTTSTTALRDMAELLRLCANEYVESDATAVDVLRSAGAQA